MTYPTNTDWNQLAIDHENAYLKGDLATSSPENYTVEEMRAISDAMFVSTAEVEAALKSDFAAMPPFAQGRMLDLLKHADPSNYEWWHTLLVGEMPDSLNQISIPE